MRSAAPEKYSDPRTRGRHARRLGFARLSAFEDWRKNFERTVGREPTIQERVEQRAKIREAIT